MDAKKNGFKVKARVRGYLDVAMRSPSVLAYATFSVSVSLHCDDVSTAILILIQVVNHRLLLMVHTIRAG